MQSYLVVGSASSTPPIALAELKAHLNIIGTQDDTRLSALQWAAVDWIERQTDRAIVQTAYTEILPSFPTWWNRQANSYAYGYPPFFPPLMNTPTGLPYQWGLIQRIELSRSPVRSITSLSYYDATNALKTLTAGSDFYACTPTDRPAYLQPVNVWPIAYFRPDSVQIAYSAGYDAPGVTASNPLPGVINAAIKLLVGALNENREDFNASTNLIPSIPIGVQAMIQSISTGGYR